MITTIDKNTALVLIDLQKGIVNMPLAIPAGEVIANAAKLVKAFRKKDLPVIVVNVNPSDSPLLKVKTDRPMQPMNLPAEWIEIVPELGTLPTDIFITKKTWNAFTNPLLQQSLQERNITQIVIAGIATSIGVEGTARNASELGYNISFATDAMADTSSDAHSHSMNFIFPRLGETGTTAEIIERL